MIHTKLSFGCVRASLAAAIVMVLTACGGGGGGGGGGSGPPGGSSSGGGSSATDTTPPETTIVTKPPAATTATSASFTFSSSEAGSTFEVSVDGGAFASSGASFDFGGLTEGEHTLSVRAIDAAKNVDATPATATWRVDFTAPTSNVYFPPAHSYTDASEITLRGKVTDATGISSMKVNNTSVTPSNDGSWSVSLPLVSGENQFIVSTTDSLGTTKDVASNILVTKGGPTLSYVRAMDLDVANNRLLLADYERRAILAVNVSNGAVSVFAAYDQADPAPLYGVSNLVVDAAGHRVLAVDVLSDQLVAIDLTTKARTVISPSSKSAAGSTNIVAVAADLTGIALDSANNAVYVTRSYDPGTAAPAGVLKISLADGTRTIVTGSLNGGSPVGTGAMISAPTDVVLDSSTTPARLLVADAAGEIVAVDTTNGTRTTFVNNAMGTGPAVGTITRMRIDQSNGRLLVTSGGSYSNQPHGVFAIDLATKSRTQIVDSSSANEPLAGAFLIALDSADQHVYLANFPTTEIFRADLAGGSKPVLIAHNNVGTGYKPTSVRNVAVRGGSLYFVDTGLRALIKVDAATGNRTILSANGVGTGPSIGLFESIAIDEASGRVLTADVTQGVLAIDLATGNRTALSSNSIGTGVSYDYPTILAWDPAGNRALVVDQTHTLHAALLSVDAQGNRTSIADLQLYPSYVGSSGLVLDGPAGEATSKALVLLNGDLYGVDLSTGARTPYASGQSNNKWNGMWIYPKQRGLIITNGQNLTRYDFINAPEVVSGRTTNGTIGTGIDLLYPNGVAADADANVAYVADLMNSGLVAVDLTNGQRAILSR